MGKVYSPRKIEAHEISWLKRWLKGQAVDGMIYESIGSINAIDSPDSAQRFIKNLFTDDKDGRLRLSKARSSFNSRRNAPKQEGDNKIVQMAVTERVRKMVETIAKKQDKSHNDVLEECLGDAYFECI